MALNDAKYLFTLNVPERSCILVVIGWHWKMLFASSKMAKSVVLAQIQGVDAVALLSHTANAVNFSIELALIKARCMLYRFDPGIRLLCINIGRREWRPLD